MSSGRWTRRDVSNMGLAGVIPRVPRTIPSAGEAGAAMLLSRARTQLDKATSRVSPDTR